MNTGTSGWSRGLPRFMHLAIVAALVLGSALIAGPAQAATTLYVDNTVTCYDNTSDSSALPYCTIQAAIDDAAAGDTINVAAGTYEEQVVIDKDLTLQGAGPSTVILSPDNLTEFFATSANNYPIVYIHDTADVTVQDLVVDGAGKGNANNRFIGVGFQNAGGTVDTVEIKDIRDTPFSGSQHGVALYVYNTDGTTRTVNVWDSVFTGFQKNAMALNAASSTGLVVDVQGNQVTGAGATDVTAQNGIQVWSADATGTIADNTVTGIGYDNTANPTKWVASSILNYYADLTIDGNTISNGHVGIYSIDGPAQITENDLDIEKIGVSAYGIIATDPPQVVPSPFGELDLASAAPSNRLDAVVQATTLDVDVLRNDINFDGTDNTDTFGIETDAGYGPDNLDLVALNNAVSGFDVGVEVYECQSDCDAGLFTNVDVNDNSISGSGTAAVRSNVSYLTVDASGNWLDSTDPTTVAGAVSGDVDYTPWLASGTDSDSGTAGFQGDFSELWVDDDSPQTGSVGHIQEGIDLVTASTVNVAAGTYVEDVLIDKPLNLRGAQADVDVATRTPGDATESTIQGMITVDASNVEINGFTVTNPSENRAIFVDNASPSHSAVAIKHNIVDNVGGSSVTSSVKAVYVYRGADNVSVVGNQISNVQGDTKSVDAISILDTASSDPSNGLLIEDNTISNVTSGPTNPKGAYGIIINNAAGAPGAQILDNSFSNLDGGWTHAVGMEGPTENAVVSGNEFTNLTADGADNIAVFFEDNEHGGTVTVEYNLFNSTDFYGVAVHPNDLPGGANGYAYVVAAEDNWWAAASGPSGEGAGSGAAVGPNVDYSPWCANAACTAAGQQLVDTGNPTDNKNALQTAIDNASPGDVIILAPGATYDGGLVFTTSGITIILNGSTITAGSPAFTVTVPDVTLIGLGTLDGGGSGDPAVLVDAGGDNFTLKNITVTDWADGVEVAADVTSLKLISNFLHANADAGLQVNGGVEIGGVVTIEGNLFKANGGNGIQNDGDTNPLPAQYNSWGDIGGPSTGDGISAQVDASNHTFAELYMDMDLGDAADDTTQVSVNESESFDVALKADAANLFGLSFRFGYDDSMLTLNGSPTFASPWAGRCFEDTTSPASGTIDYICHLQAPDAEWTATGGTVATFNFTAEDNSGLSGNGPWYAYFDIDDTLAESNAGAVGGINVYVNNAGYGDPSVAARGITDADDGEVEITGIAQFTGYIDLQGRHNDSGATLDVYDAAAETSATLVADATSAASGGYTTSYTSGNLLTVGTTYFFQVDAPLYLPTTAVPVSTYDHSHVLDTRPETALSTVVLLGGDATDDNAIGIGDASCIGDSYLGTSSCVGGPNANADVNGDGVIDILDLTLAGGNFTATASPWTP